MSFVLPNPTTPTNGTPGDATPILQNEQAIAQAISNFDGSQINSKSIVEGALADTINPRLRGSETLANFVYSGCIWSLVSGLSGTMTGGTIYVNGYRTIVTGVGAQTFTASNDTYVDIDYLGNITYNGVANNATAPSLTANALRVAKVVTSGSAITNIYQSFGSVAGWYGFDGLGNPVRLTSIKPLLLGYVETATGNTTNSASYIDFNTPLTTTIITPTNCYAIEVGIVIPVASNTGGMNLFIAVTDSANNIQAEQSWASVDANAAHFGVLSFTRIIAVTPNTSYTYKARVKSNGTAVVTYGATSTTSNTSLTIKNAS